MINQSEYSYKQNKFTYKIHFGLNKSYEYAKTVMPQTGDQLFKQFRTELIYKVQGIDANILDEIAILLAEHPRIKNLIKIVDGQRNSVVVDIIGELNPNYIKKKNVNSILQAINNSKTLNNQEIWNNNFDAINKIIKRQVGGDVILFSDCEDGYNQRTIDTVLDIMIKRKYPPEVLPYIDNDNYARAWVKPNGKLNKYRLISLLENCQFTPDMSDAMFIGRIQRFMRIPKELPDEARTLLEKDLGAKLELIKNKGLA